MGESCGGLLNMCGVPSGGLLNSHEGPAGPQLWGPPAKDLSDGGPVLNLEGRGAIDRDMLKS